MEQKTGIRNPCGPKIVHAACWAHARRKFFQAVELNPQDQSALRLVAQMDELFALDAQAREHGLSQEDRQLLRLEKSKPLLKEIKIQIQSARTGALPKSVLAKACNYTLTLWTRLTRFLEYPELELSNNLAERHSSNGTAFYFHRLFGGPIAGLLLEFAVGEAQAGYQRGTPQHTQFLEFCSEIA